MNKDSEFLKPEEEALIDEGQFEKLKSDMKKLEPELDEGFPEFDDSFFEPSKESNQKSGSSRKSLTNS